MVAEVHQSAVYPQAGHLGAGGGELDQIKFAKPSHNIVSRIIIRRFTQLTM